MFCLPKTAWPPTLTLDDIETFNQRPILASIYFEYFTGFVSILAGYNCYSVATFYMKLNSLHINSSELLKYFRS